MNISKKIPLKKYVTCGEMKSPPEFKIICPPTTTYHSPVKSLNLPPDTNYSKIVNWNGSQFSRFAPTKTMTIAVLKNKIIYIEYMLYNDSWV